MAMYIALRLEAGKMNYNSIFRIKLYAQFKDDVDSILTADGYAVGEDGWAVKTNTAE